MRINFTLKSIYFLLLCCFTATIVSAQSGNWTWMKGANTINNIGQGGIPNIPNPANNPAARRYAAYWKDNQGNFWIFGGVGTYALSTFGDIWKFNPSTLEWTPIQPEDPTRPSPRFSSAYWTDPSGNFWLYGGFGWPTPGSGVQSLSDLWKFNPVTRIWTLVKGTLLGEQPPVFGNQAVSNINSTPGCRYDAACWTDATGNLWLFGGTSLTSSHPAPGLINDLWKYDPVVNTWTWMKGDTTIGLQSGVYGTQNVPSSLNKPGARSASITWTDHSNNLWLYGGITRSDLWKYTIATNEWVWVNGYSTPGFHYSIYGTTGVPDPTNAPGSNNVSTGMTDVDGNLWMFGGRGTSDTQFGDLNGLWKYNIANNVWTFAKGDYPTYSPGVYGTITVPAVTNRPGGREGMSGWADNAGNLWIFGGGYTAPSGGTGNDFNDVWKFTPSIVVPVKLISFSGQLSNTNTASLKWVVENENNLAFYEIERSVNGTDFKKIKQTNAAQQRTYATTDDVAEFEGRIIYYRLKMIDVDGKFNYSNIIKFNIPVNTTFSLYPNPANDYTKLKLNTATNGDVHFRILDATGKLVLENNKHPENAEIFISTKKLPGGMYVIMIDYEGKHFSQPLVIER